MFFSLTCQHWAKCELPEARLITVGHITLLRKGRASFLLFKVLDNRLSVRDFWLEVPRTVEQSQQSSWSIPTLLQAALISLFSAYQQAEWGSILNLYTFITPYVNEIQMTLQPNEPQHQGKEALTGLSYLFPLKPPPPVLGLFHKCRAGRSYQHSAPHEPPVGCHYSKAVSNIQAVLIVYYSHQSQSLGVPWSPFQTDNAFPRLASNLYWSKCAKLPKYYTSNPSLGKDSHALENANMCQPTWCKINPILYSNTL